MTGLAVTLTESGLYLPALDLHLDPKNQVPRAFISHAHADHADESVWQKSGILFASTETLSLLEARHGAPAASARVIPWDSSVELSSAKLTIAPAGHMLGAAQLIVDHAGGRCVYTGDYQSGAGCTHPAGAAVPCDELIIESTFALPIFRFPDRGEVRNAIVAFCKDRLAEGQTPVLIAYSLGKSQELVHALLAAEVPVVAHGAVYRMCRAYEALGVPLGVADGRLRAYSEEPEKKRRRESLGAVLIVPPSAHAHPMVRKRNDACIAYVSGWALIDASIERHRADAGFVLSDHADHDDLVATARATGARTIYTTLGDAEILAAFLADRAEAIPLVVESLDTAPGRAEAEPA